MSILKRLGSYNLIGTMICKFVFVRGYKVQVSHLISTVKPNFQLVTIVGLKLDEYNTIGLLDHRRDILILKLLKGA